MYLPLSTILALSTVSVLNFCTAVIATHSRFHRHQVDKHVSHIVERDAGSVEIPVSDLQLLRMETTAFQDWMHAWISTANASNPFTNLAQLELQFQAYDGWMTAWLDSTLAPGPSAPPPLPSSVPIIASTSSSSTSSSEAALTTAAPVQQVIIDVSTSSSALPETSTTSKKSLKPGEFFESPATTLIPVPSPSAAASSAAADQEASSASVMPLAPSTSTAPVATPDSQPIMAPNPASPGSGSFNDQASNNLAVYYGQSPATSQTTLAQMCQDSNVDIVILAFLDTFFGAGGYPGLNLGSACSGPSEAMQAAGASNLLSCPTLENDIKICQSLGKKVLLSLGGAKASTAFSSDEQASGFATQLWNLFGGGNGEAAEMRPFGTAVLDGFDVDNEDKSTAFWSTFVSSLRKTMDADSSKKYYISAAPQCLRPDASIPLDAMQSMDFVFVQFYNNGACNVGQSGFGASLKAWSQDLAGKGTGPKLFVGAPGCTACAGSGYLSGSQIGSIVEEARAAGIVNMGGVMLWDGPEGKANVESGKDFLSVVKGAMG
ncbi:MAG: hypothetical protein Q9183_001942 [Haloplaca sp. 2 TL-2023]